MAEPNTKSMSSAINYYRPVGIFWRTHTPCYACGDGKGIENVAGTKRQHIKWHIKWLGQSMTLLGTLCYAQLSNIQKLKYPEMADITSINAVRCAMADYVRQAPAQWLHVLSCCIVCMVNHSPLNSSGPVVIPDHSVWNMWWTQHHQDRFFSEYFSFTLSVSFH